MRHFLAVLSLSSVLLPSSSLLAASGTLAVELVTPSTDLVQGEPLRVFVKLRNEGDGAVEVLTGTGSPVEERLFFRAAGGEVEPCDGSGWLGNPTPIGASGHPNKHPVILIQPNETMLWSIDVKARCHVSGPGVFEFFVRDYFNARPTPVTKPLSFAFTADSPWLKVTIAKPTGIDAAAYEAFGGRPFAKKDRNRLFREFPESVYAGWALLSTGVGGVPLNVADGDEAFRGLLRSYKDGGLGFEDVPLLPDGTPRPETAPGKALKYAPLMERFLDAHPNAVTSPVLRMKLGLHYAVLHRWQEARSLLEASIAEPWTAVYGPESQIQQRKAVLRQLIVAMEKQGLVPPPTKKPVAKD